MMVLFLLVAAEINWLELGSYRVSANNNGFSVLHVEALNRQPVRKTGRMLTASGAGVLFERAGKVYFYPFDHGEAYVLPDPGGLVLAAPLPYVFLPAFFEAEALVLFYDGAWRRIQAAAWCELSTPKTALGSRIGLNLLVPSAIQVGPTTLSIYQQKTGELILYNLANSQRTQKMLSKKLVPFKLAGDVLWLDAPKKGRLALSTAAAPTFIHHIKIPDLSRHSPVWPVADGCWLFTFADGFSDALNSWDSGTVPVRAHFIRVKNRRLTKRSFPSSGLPVRFLMETSASGSPRLAINPEFRVLPVQGDNRLVVFYETSYYVLEPERGAGQLTTLASPESPPVAVIPTEAGLDMLLADGKRVTLN